MDPQVSPGQNTQPSGQSTEPQAPQHLSMQSPPPSPPTPTQPSAAVAPSNALSGNPGSGAILPKKSNLVPIVIGIVSVVILLGIGVFVYLYVLGMQATNASSNFMKYETSGQPDKAIALSTASTQSEKDFLVQAADATKGSSKLTQHKATTKTKAYFLYDLTNSTNKYARTTVEKVDGKWKVTSYVYGPNPLALEPTAATSTSSAPAATPTTTATCLAAADFDALYKAINGTTRPASLDYSKANNPYVNNVHFDPDSLNFSMPESANTDMITNFANFAKQNAGKSFTIHLEGSVATTKQADLDFANQRAQKIKNMLTSQGAPASVIVIDAPSSVASYGGTGDAAEQRTARSVVLKIDPSCSAATSSTGR